MIIKANLQEYQIPDCKKITGKICFIGDLTCTNRDLQPDVHKGFTIGHGKVFYWMMIWHKSGNVTVIPRDNPGYRRWLRGDTEITIHFL